MNDNIPADNAAAPQGARVYAYGCAEPSSGLDAAMAEHERCTILWDQLVKIDHTIDKELRRIACDDDPQLARIGREIEALTARLADNPKDKGIREQRRGLYAEQREHMAAWRQEHKPLLQEYETRRLTAVKAALQQTDAWWPNYNRVRTSYDTGRAVARQKGRLLRFHDAERDDGVLAIQIQRSPSTVSTRIPDEESPRGYRVVSDYLGASPGEVHNGSIAMFRLGRVDAAAYDPSAAHLGERSRLWKTTCEMQIDKAGNMLTLPVWFQRPLPADARIKSAQIVWRRRGARLRWKLCITLTMAVPPVRMGLVEFDWQEQPQLAVMRIGDRVWHLSERWHARMDHVERMQRWLDEALASAQERWSTHPVAGPLLLASSWQDRISGLAVARPQLPEEIILWWVNARRLWLGIPGARAHALGDRTNTYRHWGREVASLYQAIQLPDLNLAQIARTERGTPGNSVRHRAALHFLRGDLIHQCSKAGVPVYTASGEVINGTVGQKSTAWARRKGAKKERSQPPAQVPDSSES
jgi:hypothetical protein